MKSTLVLLAEKNDDWIRIVRSFGCNETTSQDIVQEMYIKIDKKIKNGLNIDFGKTDYNYYYIFKTLKTLFLDLKRKEAKVKMIELENVRDHLSDFDCQDYDQVYSEIQNELNNMYWYDKKIFQIIEGGESIAELSRKSGIPYYSLYNTYKKVVQKLKKLL